MVEGRTTTRGKAKPKPKAKGTRTAAVPKKTITAVRAEATRMGIKLSYAGKARKRESLMAAIARKKRERKSRR